MKTAVILVNIGTPRKASYFEVARFLFRFLNDKRVITLAFWKRFLLVNLIIIPSRLRKSTKRYKQFFQSKRPSINSVSKELESKLDNCLSNDYKSFVAMQYTRPRLKNVLKKVHRERFEKVVLIPLFPQYAEATTGSVIANFQQITSRWSVQPEVKIVESFYSNKSYLQALSSLLINYKTDDYEHVIFSYHSLPLSQVALVKNTSRCYQTACESTTHLIAQQLGLNEKNYTTTYQSHISKRWLGPFTNDVLAQLAREGKKRVLLISPSFVADCLETTHELEVESAELFYQNGGKLLKVAPSLNSSEAWIKTLLELSTT